MSTQDKYNAPFPSNLRTIIDERGTTITALARELGITRQAVSQYADGTGQQPDSNYIILFKADAALYYSVCFFVVLKECISASLDWHCMWYSYSKLVDMQI